MYYRIILATLSDPLTEIKFDYMFPELVQAFKRYFKSIFLMGMKG